jgi:hypothetical protein
MPAATCPPSFPRYRQAASALTLCAALLAGCGAEVAGTAATVGKLQAEQASQARVQQQQIVDGMKQAQDAGLQRAADAASAGQ